LLLSSTFVGSEKRARALEEGADGYLLEPATPEFLLANIKMLLRQCLDAGEIVRSLSDERRRSRALEGLVRFAVVINSAESLDEILQVAAREARELIGAHQAVASLNPGALYLIDPAASAISLSEKYAQEAAGAGAGRRGAWFSSLVCRLNQTMRLTQAELEWRLDWQKTHDTHDAHCHPRALEGVVTPCEIETLRWLACLREITGLHEVATPREIACLREVAAARKPQMAPGLDMRGWLAAPLSGRDSAYGRNLGAIQLSDKYDGDFTEQDEAELAQLALVVSIAVENRLCLRREQKLREAAENAARAKDEFIAMTSYRLRAQLNTLLGWSWVLRRQAENMEDLTRAAEIIERAARTQAGLVEDLLGVSRTGAVNWKEGEAERLGDGGIVGLEKVEAEEWGDWEAGRLEGVETEGSKTLSVPQSLFLSTPPSLRPYVHYSPDSARGAAASGGC
jgi:GAF domain-containing protein